VETFSVDSLLCRGGTVNLVLHASEVGIRYRVYVDGVDAVTLVGDGNSISYTYSINEVGIRNFKVEAEREDGICSVVNFGTKKVRSLDAIEGEARLKIRRRICISEESRENLDTIAMTGVLNVTYMRWTFGDGVEIVDTIENPGSWPMYVVRYRSSGEKVWEVKYGNPCSADTLVYRDTVKVLSYPVAEAGIYSRIPMYYTIEYVTLDGQGSSQYVMGADSLQYRWYVEAYEDAIDLDKIIAKFKPVQLETKVALTVSHKDGLCPVTDSAIVLLDVGIFIPNVFTPNGDGSHDMWEIENIQVFYPKARVRIYNKWGAMIREWANGYNEPWDGKRNGEEMPSATYYYIIEFGNGVSKAGSVTLMR
jgi:gliding motility-associated-like protein